MEKSNTINGGKIKIDEKEIRAKVADSMKLLQNNFAEMTHDQVAASTIALPLPVVKAKVKVGSVLNLHFDLENNNGKLEFSKNPPLLQVNKEKGFALGVSVMLPIAPGTSAGGSIAASYKKQRTFEPLTQDNRKANQILGKGWKDDPTLLSTVNKEKPVNGIVQAAVNDAYAGTLDDHARTVGSGARGLLNKIGDFLGS